VKAEGVRGGAACMHGGCALRPAGGAVCRSCARRARRRGGCARRPGRGWARSGPRGLGLGSISLAQRSGASQARGSLGVVAGGAAPGGCSGGVWRGFLPLVEACCSAVEVLQEHDVVARRGCPLLGQGSRCGEVSSAGRSRWRLVGLSAPVQVCCVDVGVCCELGGERPCFGSVPD
jgi:hypothetical protein